MHFRSGSGRVPSPTRHKKSVSMESCFPCPAGLPFHPVHAGDNSYRTESARTFPIMSKFWYSSGMDTSRFFIYQLSQSRMTFFCSRHSGITWRIMPAAGSSFVFCFATYDNRVKPKARKFYPLSRSVRRASGWQNSALSGRKNPCERHKQTGLKHLQILAL